ncbi:MAG TPA: hypothetical protein VGI25_03995 [Candidatus Udaeobacter sp.]|jgi:hypothetical protein
MKTKNRFSVVKVASDKWIVRNSEGVCVFECLTEAKARLFAAVPTQESLNKLKQSIYERR